MTDLLLLLPLALCLWGFCPVKGIRSEALSQQGTASVRGALALGILFVHIAQYCPGGAVFAVMEKAGYLLVAVFFFLTGYGLQRQHMTRPDYRRGFLRRRVLAVALPYLVITAVYWSYHRLQGRPYGLGEVLARFVQGVPLVSFSWFIPGVLTFYLAFWGLMLLCKQHHRTMILGATVWFCLYTADCVLLGWGQWWYVSAFPAVVGVAWAVCEEGIENALKKRYYLWLGLALLSLAGTLFVGSKVRAGAADALLKGYAATLFCVVVVLLLYKFRLGNPVLRLLGQMSMELYLMQGLAIMVLRSRWIYVNDPVLYGALILALTVALAAVVFVAFKGISKKPTR